MLPPNQLAEISIKVPAPFAGVTDLGFTAQYHPQDFFAPLRDVPLVIEGRAGVLQRLTERLRLLRGLEEAHTWSDPVLLSDEVAVIAFRDRSLEGRTLSDGAQSSLDYVLNLVQPVVFPFLQDCATVAQVKLADRIELRIQATPVASRGGDPGKIAELQLRLEQIVQPNGVYEL
ncbi:MAG TPA: hypothetical protein VF137_05505 [Candidatus Dormibacteraeota bacterium]